MTEQRSRFKHLERKRQTSGGPEPSSQADLSRFSRLETSDEDKHSEGRSELAEVDPPTADEAPSEASLVTESRGNKDQPFVRCAKCEVDNSIYVTECRVCGANLDTDEQRHFNEEFWKKRQVESEQIQKEVEAIHEAQRNQQQEVDASVRELAILRAEQVKRQTLERLGDYETAWSRRMGIPIDFGTNSRGPRPSLLREWLQKIENPRHRLIVIGLLIAVPFALLYFPQRGSTLWSAGFVAAIMVVILFFVRR